MTLPRRQEKKKYEKDFAAFCRITRQYFPDLIQWLREIKDPRKFWTYETEVMLMTVIMKNICNISSMQKMTDDFLNEDCVGNLCRILGVEPHEFLPHYVTLNEFLSRLETRELERLRKNMIRALLRRRKFEDAGFLGKYWRLVFDFSFSATAANTSSNVKNTRSRSAARIHVDAYFTVYSAWDLYLLSEIFDKDD